MSNIDANATTDRYARCIAASKRIRWDIDADVIRGRTLDVADELSCRTACRSSTSSRS